MTSAVQGKSRFRELDAFRGIAAIWVVLFHFFTRYAELFPGTAETGQLAAAPARLLSGTGAWPVYWFFMISGFVIVWTLERCTTWRDFAVARFSRLYPTFWASVLATFSIGMLFPLPIQKYDLWQLVVNLTMFESMVGVPDIDGSYWSLAVELLFYIAIGALFALGGLRHLVSASLIWALACLVTSLVLFEHLEIFWRVRRYFLLDYGHFLICGIMYYQIWRGANMKFAASIIGICLVSIFVRYEFRIVLACVCFNAIFFLAIINRLRWIVLPPLVWLGSISYALYVCHEYIGYRIIMALEAAGISRIGAILGALASVLLLAWAITSFIDRPAQKAIRAAWSRISLPARASTG